ncbi:unnamed protein product, partial [Rotaria magnacalcarata]
NQYPYGGNQYPNRNGYRSNVYRRNIFYNRNNQQQQRPYNAYDIGGYGIVNQSYIPPPRRSVRQRQRGTSRQNQPRIGSNQQRRSQSRQPQQQQQQCRRRPRQLRLNDFMPTQLRDPSPTTSNLPTGFNLGTTTTTVTTAPSDALPQRQIFAATNTANNVTQPFMVNQQQQQAASTTSSTYRRRQRRGRQQQYRQISYENNNRFAELAEDNDNDDEYPMSKMTKDFRTQAMTVYVQSLGREHELLTNEIKRIIEGFPQENDDGFDAEAGCAAFKQYHELPEKRFNLETDQSIYFLDEQRVEDEDNNQEPNKTNEVELAHLYYLPKAHKPGTPLRPIISGLKHPTIKISKFLDDLLRPLFDQMALNSTVTSSFDLVKQLQQWSRNNFKRETLFCTIDVTDLYTMVSQIEGVLSLRKMLDELKLKQVGK